MSGFEFPTNIKQIGSIGDGIRIYIEDYACSYLQQYAEAGGYEERLAFLVGRSLVIDGQTVLFISGLVQGLYTTVEKDTMIFTEKSWKHAKEEIKRYFKGLDIVGWMQSQPGYGVYLNESYAANHKKLFSREDQVMFVIDPAEKLNAFYIFDERQENLVESQGYFIYYDKNRGMHEYMLDNKITKLKVRPLPEVEEAAEPVIKEINEMRKKTPMAVRLTPKRNQPAHEKAPMYTQKRVVNLLLSLSAVLFIVCFIMGAGLIQNDGRMTTMESQLTQLNTAYRDLLVQLTEDKTTSVFANQTDPVADALEEPVNPQERAMMITEDGNQLINEHTIAQAEDNTQAQAEPPLTQLEPYVAPSNASIEAIVAEAAATASAIPDTYTVQAGDSLSFISLKFYGNTNMVSEIMTLNKMDDADKIYFGKVLKLPKN